MRGAWEVQRSVHAVHEEAYCTFKEICIERSWAPWWRQNEESGEMRETHGSSDVSRKMTINHPPGRNDGLVDMCNVVRLFVDYSP